MSSYFEKRVSQVKKPSYIDQYFGNLYTATADKMTADKIRTFQKMALKQIIDNAYKNCDFYREKMNAAGVTPTDIKDVSDLGKMPFTAKDELRGNPWALLACDKEDVSIITVSTGTTGGQEIYIPSTWRDYSLNDMTPRYPDLFPVEKGDICINALPYEMSSAGLAFHKTFMDACLATVVGAGKGGAYSNPEKTVKIIRDLQPTIIITTPSWAISLAEEAEQMGFDMSTLPLRKMWLTGEGCSDSFRKRIEKIYGTTANTYYGSLECGGIGIECDNHNGYHLLQGHVIIEIVDPVTNEVLEPGEIGEIVVTCPLRYDAPLIRYRTQDIGYIDLEPCECGVTAPKLFLRGRVRDQININGNSFSPFYFEEFLMRIPEVGNWYQFVIKPGGVDLDHLKARVELAKGVEPSLDLADKIASKLEFAIGIPCEIELLEKLPRTSQKTLRVVEEE